MIGTVSAVVALGVLIYFGYRYYCNFFLKVVRIALPLLSLVTIYYHFDEIIALYLKVQSIIWPAVLKAIEGMSNKLAEVLTHLSS